VIARGPTASQASAPVPGRGTGADAGALVVRRGAGGVERVPSGWGGSIYVHQHIGVQLSDFINFLFYYFG